MLLNWDNTYSDLRFKKIQQKIHYTAKLWKTLYPNWMFARKFIWCFIVQFYASSISNWPTFKLWTLESIQHKENSVAHIHFITNWQVMLNPLHLLHKLIHVASTHTETQTKEPHTVTTTYTKIKPSSSKDEEKLNIYSKQMTFQLLLWIINFF